MRIFLIEYLQIINKNKKKAAKKTAKNVVKTTKPKTIKTVTTTVTTTTTTTTAKIVPQETHYLLILDESGSMSNIKSQTLSGLNEQLKAIKNLGEEFPDQKYFVSIVKFDNEIVSLIDDIPSTSIKQLNDDDYIPDATTALRDAIGVSVNKLKNKIQTKLDSGEACAFVVILTDGLENASKEYSSEQIKSLITNLEKTELWTFTFIGANQDSVLTANNFGILTQNTSNFTASGTGAELTFASLSSSLKKRAHYRSAGIYTNDSYLSEVVNCSNNIGEDASLLDLSGKVSNEDIQKAKDALDNKNNGGGSTI